MVDSERTTLSVGLHLDVPHDVYHADPAERPSLSSHLAKVLLGQSAAHARLQHPRLGGAANTNHSDAMDAGSIIHGILLGGGQELVEIHADDWRKDAAKKAKAEALAAGKIAVLSARLVEIRHAADRVREALPFDFADAECEASAIWESDGCLCRCRIDARFDGVRIADLKTTEDAATASAARNIIARGGHIQAAANIEAIETLFPHLCGRVSFVDAFAETVPPYGVIVVEMAGTMLELGRRQWKRAKELWSQCLATDTWPGYPAEVVRVEAPAWALTDEMNEQMKQIEGGSRDVGF